MSLLLAWLVAYFRGTLYVYLIKVHVPIKVLIFYLFISHGSIFLKVNYCFFYTTHNSSDTKCVDFPLKLSSSQTLQTPTGCPTI